MTKYLVLSLLFLLGLSACGYKDKPIPPQRVVPKAVSDFRVELDDKGALLSWSFPRETVSGRKITEIDSFDLYRAELPVHSYCPTCPVPYSVAIVVPGGALPVNGDRTVTYLVKELRPGNLYFFKLRSKVGWWIESRDSNEISFLWQTPPKTPEGFMVKSGEGQNVLQWQPVSASGESAQATPIIRYQLYRGVDVAAVAKIAEPLSATSYTDTAVEDGKVYVYQVQASSSYPQGMVKSGLSSPVEARPQDRTPPPLPHRVEGMSNELGVRVYWDAVQADDLAAYRVYRRQAHEQQATLIGEVKEPNTLFLDSQAPAVPCFYSVSSVDTQTPPNESKRSVEVRVEL